MAPKSEGPESSARKETEQLVHEVVHDAVSAARAGWRVAHRVGRAGLRWVEKAADEVAKELE